MRVLYFYKKLKYSLNPCFNHRSPLSPASTATNCVISSNGSLFHQIHNPISSKSYISSIISSGKSSNSQTVNNLLRYGLCSRKFLTYDFRSRFYSTSRTNNNEVSTGCVIDVIRADAKDMEYRLNLMGLDQLKFILEILCCLNILKVPALRFFNWFKELHPSYSRNADLCSLAVANCGVLGDHKTMVSLLKSFRDQQICLSEKAFGFLPVLSTSMENEADKKCVREVVGILNEVGGSCRNSGIHSLIRMLCSWNSFDLAKYVIEITERKVSCYNILVKHLCTRGQFEDAQNLFEEMRRLRCDPDCNTYNYLISSLCKQGTIDEAFSVFQEMPSRGCSPNLITFETLIFFACRYGKSDQAVMFYDLMVSSGVKPCLSTHYAFIRGFFRSQRFEEAYKYIVNTSVKDKCSAQEIYNVLVSLHNNDGNYLVAHNLLVEMFEKGLKPKHSTFLKTTKCLRKSRKANFAANLKALYGSRVAG